MAAPTRERILFIPSGMLDQAVGAFRGERELEGVPGWSSRKMMESFHAALRGLPSPAPPASTPGTPA